MRVERLSRCLLVASILIAGSLCRAQVAPPPPVADSLGTRLHRALDRFEFGDYEAVVAELEALVERGARELPSADRLEVLRAYGISCALVGRPTAAEGAFLLLLEADPRAVLDRHNVRPEAVAVFDSVRVRRSQALLAAYRRGKAKRYLLLNLIPPAGQFQNRDHGKAYTLLALELSLLATNITTGSLLYAWRGDNQDFPGHEESARFLRPLNWVSFGVLVTCVVYGIIDGFVVGHRRSHEEGLVEQRLTAQRATLDLSGPGFGVQF